MSRVRVELNPAGVTELFKSAEVQQFLQEAGDAVASRASSMSGEHYSARVHNAGFTAICNVYPDSREAAIDNSDNNTLLKAAGELGMPQTKQHI